MNQPCFKDKPIASTAALARALHIPHRHLTWATNRADRLYRALQPMVKPDGSIRQVFNPARPLKDIQRRINRHIFGRVDFPFYLQGGIRDRKNPRHCLANAKLHSDAKIVINEDISGFFPSITKRQVQNIWQHFFRFPPDIAIILTKLTIHDGQLPQGAPTSSYLANLALWEHEPPTVEALFIKGIRYSRYIDDITLSSTYFQNDHSKTAMIRKVRSMCNRNKYEVKRSKHRIESSGQPMRINNLQINNGISLPKRERACIRAAVHSCEKHIEEERTANEYHVLFNSTVGRVNHLRQFHRHEGKRLLKRLDACAPL
ncbi:MAG TPA: RNA-directed DNA polymerase [Acidiferrobacteraceae bacterium]|nr:RNA-directed DNA polymerase [Acidiferrobacteraceae bacterium]